MVHIVVILQASKLGLSPLLFGSGEKERRSQRNNLGDVQFSAGKHIYNMK